MFDRRWRKVLRDAWLHRSRTILVVLAIAIGIAGAGIVLNAWALVRVATRDGYAASNPAAATLRTDSIDEALLARVRAVPAIREAQARRTVIGRIQADGAWRTALLYVYRDFAAIRIGLVKPETGAWPPPEGALVIERSSLDFSGASVGSALSAQVGESPQQGLQLLGVARDVGLAPGWMEHVVYGFITPGTAASLGAPATMNELQLTVRDNALDREAIRRVAFEVRALLERNGHPVSNVDVPPPGEHIHAAQMDSLLLTQGAFGALALLLSGFLVLNLISAMLVGQVREIGVMKAIGASSGQVGAMYLVLALVLGALASAIALPVAYAGGTWYAALKAELLNFDIAGFRIPWWSLALQGAVGVLLPVCAAAIPVRHGCRISVSRALRDFGVEASAPSSAPPLYIAGLSRPLLLSLRNTFRRRQRMIFTLLALATGGAVFLGARNLKAAIRGSVDLLFAPNRYDLVVRLSEPHRVDSIEQVLTRVQGVRDAEAWSGARAAIPHTDGTLGNSFAVTAPPANTGMLSYPIVEGRWLQPGDSTALVVSRVLLRGEPSLTVGRNVRLIIGGRETTWNVVGIVDGGPTPTAYAARETIAPLVAGGLSGSAVVAFEASGVGIQVDVIQRLREALGASGLAVASTQLLLENRRVMEDHLLMVADFLGAMAWLMIAVGGLGLASTMSLSVLERTREIGVLRAIGARHRAIFTMVQVEGLVIGGLSWLIALPLSLPMSVALGRAFGRVMLPVPDRYLPEAAGVFWWFALVVVVAVIASAMPALRAMRITTAAALAYE